MAIMKYSQGPGATTSNFRAWLDSMKTGTFLENYTITQKVPGSSSEDITFVDPNDNSNSINIHFSPSGETWENHIVDYAWGDTTFDSVKWTSSDYILLSSALLGKNGLMINIKGTNSDLGLYDVTQAEYCITYDANGLVLICGYMGVGESHFNPPTSGGTYNIIAPTGISTGLQIKPTYGAAYTTIARCLNNVGGTIPHLYSATNTQFDNNIAADVVADGNHYIANGRWYIDDLD